MLAIALKQTSDLRVGAAAFRRFGLSTKFARRYAPCSGKVLNNKRHFSHGGNEKEGGISKSWLARFFGPKPMPQRGTLEWYREMVLICTVFGITGSSTMMLVRPAVKDLLGIQGSFKDGPWSYRICSLVIMSPIYGVLLVVVGTAFGRHVYFKMFSVKMFSRFGIPPELLDKAYHEKKKTFRKW